MDLPEQSRVVGRCPHCGRGIIERTTYPTRSSVEFVLSHDSVEPICRWILETWAEERRKILEKIVARTTSLLPE